MVTVKNTEKRLGLCGEVVKRVYGERKCTMRIVMRFIGVLVATLLLAVPVMGISAQDGASVNGFLWNGLTYVPDIAAPALPEGLPPTGISVQRGASVNGFVWDGRTFVPDVTAIVLPEKQVGGPSGTEASGLFWNGTTFVPDSAAPALGDWGTDVFVPSNLPAPGETELTIGELARAAAKVGSDVRATGSDWAYGYDQLAIGMYQLEASSGMSATGARAGTWSPRTVSLDGVTEPARQTIIAQLAASGVTVTSAQPKALPQTGVDLGRLSGRDRQIILDQMAASGGSTRGAWSGAMSRSAVILDGLTGRDRQTIIDHLAASGVSITSAHPEGLPQTGVASEPDAPYVAPFPGDDAIAKWLASVGISSQQEPGVLPQTGVDLGGLTGRDRQTILDQMAASGMGATGAWAGAPSPRTVVLDGVTGPARQMVIDQLAASGWTVVGARPEALPQTGASPAGLTGMGTLAEREQLESAQNEPVGGFSFNGFTYVPN
jgi:ribosomal protein S11